VTDGSASAVIEGGPCNEDFLSTEL